MQLKCEYQCGSNRADRCVKRNCQCIAEGVRKTEIAAGNIKVSTKYKSKWRSANNKSASFVGKRGGDMA